MRVLIGCILWSIALMAFAEIPIERFSDQRVLVPSNGNGEDTSRSSVDSLWTLREQLQQLQQEVQALRGLSEELGHRLEMMEQQQKDRYSDLDQRLSGLAGKNATLTSSSTAAPDTQGTPQDFYTEKQRYQIAQDLVKAKKLPEAHKAFAQFLKDFPKGTLAPNAHYWLGEISLVLPKPDLDQAYEHFSYIVKHYPDHAKISASLYKLGTIHDIKGETQKANELFNRVLKQYPGSAAAQLARRYLDQ